MSARERGGSSEIGERFHPKPEARSFWQTRGPRQLSNEGARECGVNIVGFFRVLLEWAAMDEAANKQADGPQLRDTVDSGLVETTDE